MGKPMPTNNVTRFLDSRNIGYTAYELPKKKLGAEEVAQLLDVPLHLVYKTIVVERKGRGKPILAVTPGHKEVDLKALAKVAGEKKVKTATQKNAEKRTKLRAGGISPLALINKGFNIFLDISAQEQAEIYVSGGERGVNIRLPVEDLRTLTGATVAPISR
ncbi:MAG: Cys-tRNA(Pro)/Cys-tRNA(Cys) deacylase YbaK [Chloroflexi bacterium]|nr:Cys-tRNA(Pro)/Cys-tRNA(Cys) deacylase YbaK [Chloroflexota bacterium]